MRQHILIPSSRAWLTGEPASGFHASVRKVMKRVRDAIDHCCQDGESTLHKSFV